MFDISFTEILIIAAVALIVIGPERLPKVARTLGHLFGRAQRYANDVKNDIQREMELEELKEWKASIENAARSMENSVRTEMSQLQEGIETEKKPSANVAPLLSLDPLPPDPLPPDPLPPDPATKPAPSSDLSDTPIPPIQHRNQPLSDRIEPEPDARRD